MSKIGYKPLDKNLNMLLRVEISEKSALKDEHDLKVFDINIIPGKVSFWTGNQNIAVIRKPDQKNPLPKNDADAFVQQLSTVLNQISLKIGFKGMPIALEKQPELWQKWLNIRANLAGSYTGNWIDQALTKTDSKLLASETLIQHVMQDMFMNEYFRNVYGVTFIENIFYGKRTVYGLCPSPIQFNEKWLLEDQLTGSLIKFSGNLDQILDEPAFKNWLEAKSSDIISEIHMHGIYQLNKATGWCDTLESSYEISTNSYKKTLKIVLITN